MDTPGDARLPAHRIRWLTLSIASVAAVLVVALAIRAAGEPSAAAGTTPPAPTPSVSTAVLLPSASTATQEPMLPPAQDVLVLGDSLALSTYAWLADQMPDRSVTWDAVVGRSTPEALRALQVRAAQGTLPPVIVVSSGTNDADSGSLRRAAAGIVALAGPGRCIVWADVVRPETFGDGMAAANAALASVWLGHSNVVPVAWTAIIAAHPDWMSGDGLHPGQIGNEARAQAFAAGVFSCSPLDPDAPIAAKQYLPPSAFLTPGGQQVPGVGPSATSSPKPKPSSSSSATGSPSGSPSPSASGSVSPTGSDPPPDPTPTPSETPEPTTSPAATATGAGQP